METVVRGSIEEFVPRLRASLGMGELILHEEGDIILVVDTGFSGAVALPGGILRKMDLQYIGMDEFILADGTATILPIFQGKLRIENWDYKTWFVPLGTDFLLGMEALSKIGRALLLDFEDKLVELHR